MWSDGDKVIDVPFHHKRFVCVEYPGVVKNVDNALKSIGGTENVTKVYSEPNKRLSVNLRPDDAFCKPAFGERLSTTNLLMRVKRRPKKGDKSKFEYQVEVLGVIDTAYKFNAMADFQYLPFRRTESGYENISQQFHLHKNTDRNEFFNRDAPLYLPPVIFSRFDIPDKDYLYRGEISHKPGYINPDLNRPTHLIGTIRQKRTVFTRFLSYSDDIPQGPSEEANRELHKKFFKPEQEQELRKLFQKRPIWSKAALNHYFTGFKDKLKFLLPLIAFYYTNGPWRCLWIRYGYDPRKHPEAKMFQTVDYRKRQASCGDMVAIKCKRSENTLAFPALKRNAPTIPKIDLESLDPNKSSMETSKQKPETDTESVPIHIYRPERLPPCRQMFYQICDIEVDEVQDLVKKGKQPKHCDEKDGWFPRGTIEKCRDLMTEHTERLIHQSTSDKESGEFARSMRMKRLKKKKIYEEESESEEEEEEDTPIETEDEREEQEMTDINTDSILEEDLNVESMIEEDMSFMETEMLDCV